MREILPSMKTVKSWGFKCPGYDEKGEVTMLRVKACILKYLLKHNFNYISQFVTRDKVRLVDMIDFSKGISAVVLFFLFKFDLFILWWELWLTFLKITNFSIYITHVSLANGLFVNARNNANFEVRWFWLTIHFGRLWCNS